METNHDQPAATETLADIAMKLDFLALGSDVGQIQSEWLKKYAAWLRLYHSELTEAKAEIARVTADFDRVTSTLYDRVNDVIALKARAERAEAELVAARADYGEQLKPLFAKVRELEQDKARLVEVAHDAVSYVGAANYRERQEEAHEMIDSACAEERQT